MTILIKNGSVVSAQGTIQADVLIDGEKIAAVLAPGDTSLGSSIEASADRVIDATGRYVVPGGIDGHTHMEMPFGGTVASDTFETGTRAAAWGGTTTIIDFAVQKQGERVQDCLAAWHDKAAGNCAIDYGFHQVVGGVDSESLKAMDELIDEGVTTFKLFMAYPGVFLSSDGQILQAMQQAAGNGSMIMMHAENGSAIDVLIAQALAEGKTDPKYHSLTRPWETEAEAVNRAIMLARMTGAPLQAWVRFNTSITLRPLCPPSLSCITTRPASRRRWLRWRRSSSNARTRPSLRVRRAFTPWRSHVSS